jgi:hypothetical protein
MTLKPAHFREIHRDFEAPISRHDCGRHCAPLNGGEPVCCTTGHAIPVVDQAEWSLLKSQTDLWHRFKPFDAASRQVVDDLHPRCTAIECKGAAQCERENRTLACRAFPFFPYITRDDELIGMSYYWTFEDRCWVISNLRVVEQRYVREFIQAYERLFAADEEERDVNRDYSASMRRVFSRWNRPIPLIGRDGGYFKILPHGGGIEKATVDEFGSHGPYVSPVVYWAAVAEASEDSGVNR